MNSEWEDVTPTSHSDSEWEEVKPGINPQANLGFGASSTADTIGKGLQQFSDALVTGVDSIPGMGYLKKAQAAVAAPIKGQSYEDTINGYNQDINNRWNQNPGAAATGSVLFNPAGLAGAGEGLMARTAQNAVVGAADAAGRGDAGLNSSGALLGGGIGGAGAFAAGAVQPVVSKVSDVLSPKVSSLASKAADFASRHTSSEPISMKDMMKGAGYGATAYVMTGDVKKALGAAAASFGSQVLAQRGPATLASMADKVSRAVQVAPQILGKYGPILQSAAARGQQASTLFLLQKQDPQFRQMMESLDAESP